MFALGLLAIDYYAYCLLHCVFGVEHLGGALIWENQTFFVIADLRVFSVDGDCFVYKDVLRHRDGMIIKPPEKRMSSMRDRIGF